jgi:uncharacterized membrane protein YgcG
VTIEEIVQDYIRETVKPLTPDQARIKALQGNVDRARLALQTARDQQRQRRESERRAVLRVTFWGAVAMVITAGVGRLFGGVMWRASLIPETLYCQGESRAPRTLPVLEPGDCP